jgi:hypothetical protein
MKKRDRLFSGVSCLIFGLVLGTWVPGAAQSNYPDVITEPEAEMAIRLAMTETAPRVGVALRDAVQDVVTATQDPSVEEAAAAWLLAVIEKLQAALDQEDPEAVLRDSWIVLHQAESSLTVPDPPDPFGAERVHLIRGTQDARSHIVGFARIHLSAPQFARLRDITLAEEARLRAIDPSHKAFFGYRQRVGTAETQSVLSTMANATGSAFNAIPGSGVAEGAARQTTRALEGVIRLPGRAVGGVAEGVGTATGVSSIGDVSTTLRQLPTDARENAQLLLADPNFQATLTTLDGISTSTQRMAEAVEQLPGGLQGTLATVEATQPELRATVEETTRAVQSAESLLVQAEKTAQSLNVTLSTARETTGAIDHLINPPRDPAESHEPGEPFRMESVTEAAEALGVTITELKTTVRALHELAQEPQVPALASAAADESNRVVENSGRVARELVDHVVWRLWLFLAGVLVLLLAYHVARHMITARLVAKPSETAATDVKT